MNGKNYLYARLSSPNEMGNVLLLFLKKKKCNFISGIPPMQSLEMKNSLIGFISSTFAYFRIITEVKGKGLL